MQYIIHVDYVALMPISLSILPTKLSMTMGTLYIDMIEPINIGYVKAMC